MAVRRAGDDEKETEEEFEIVSYETVTAMVAMRIEQHEKQARLSITQSANETQTKATKKQRLSATRW